MVFLEQILDSPYAYLWLPGLVFFAVAGGLYWISRPASARVESQKSPESPPTVKPLLAAKPKDLRGSSRRLGNTVEVHLSKAEDKKNAEIASVLDRSMGGMRLALYHEIEIGAVVSVHPVHADNMVPWVELEIRSCKPSKEMPDQFEVGCQYVKSPPYSIQLLFG